MMRRVGATKAVALLAVAVVALAASEVAAQSRKRERERAATPTAAPVDKRDRMVTAPNTPFHGQAFWQATAQCGGIYFKLGTLLSDAAITAKVIKPDPTAYARLTKGADEANRAASALFEVAERFLVADRKIARDEAVITYDTVSSDWGDRQKTAEAAVAAATPCPGLYKTCREQFPQVCNDAAALTN